MYTRQTEIAISRYSDVVAAPASIDPMPLPVVDWRRIGASAPLVLDVAYAGPNAPLPKADAVVITWTTAEWSAFDHVFINSNSTRLPSARDWETGWLLYTADAPAIPPPVVLQPAPPLLAVNPSLAKPAGPPPPLWGYYVLVQIESQGGPLKVLLFKSNSHLAHAPGFSAVAEMTTRIIREAQPRYLYSTGTAGAARPDQKLGDVIVTNCGTIELRDDINRDYLSLNGNTFGCTDWFAPESRVKATQDYLFFSLANVVNYPALQALVGKLHAQVLGSNAITLDDLLNSALLPEKLRMSDVWSMRNTPLLSTDYYFIAAAGDAEKYCFLEMDDAVLAKVCGEMGVKCSFIRNVSDPIVPANGADGQPLPPEVRQRWSGLIYETYGLYTSVNSVLTTWATLMGINWRRENIMSKSFSIPPNAVRVWRGYRAPSLEESDFFSKLGTVFVPATVKMQIAVGLEGYIPAIPCGLPNKPEAVPDETAILFWDSQDTYTDGFKTLAVRTYTLTHGAVYRAPSGADFPSLFGGQLIAEKPVYLIDKATDWMHGSVRHLLGARPAVKTPDEFRATVAHALGTIQRSGIEGAIACAGDDYLVYWEVGSALGGIDALVAVLGWFKKIEMMPRTIDAGLWNVWPGMPINPGDGFNMQFQRRWEL